MKGKSLLLVASALSLLAGCGRQNPTSSELVSSSEVVSSSEEASSQEESSTKTSSSEESSSEATSGSESISSREDSSMETSSEESSSQSPIVEGDVIWSGINNATSVLNHYFNPMLGVKATDESGRDLTGKIEIFGHVEYGKLGQYTLTYKINGSTKTYTQTRTITVQNGTYNHPARDRVDGEGKTIQKGNGSYRNGSIPVGTTDDGNEFHRAPTYEFIDNEVFNRGALPSNQWWSGFCHANYGGVTLGTLNPLSVGYSSDGVHISNKGVGFTQYFSVADTFGVNQTTMSNFTPTFQDLYIKPSTLGASSVTRVIDYDEVGVKIATRNTALGEDEMISHLIQGSPYAFFEFKNSDSVSINLRTAAVTQPYKFYDINGTEINDNYTGSHLVIKLSQAHVGYQTTYPDPAVGAPIYKDIYYLVSAPGNSVFTLSQGSHPSSEFKQHIDLKIVGGNYLSVCSINGLDEASSYAEGAFNLPIRAYVEKKMDVNMAKTSFNYAVQHLDEGDEETLLALRPHQWKNSVTNVSPVATMQTKNGLTKVIKANSFALETEFSGVLPGYFGPEMNDGIKNNLKNYLGHLINNTIPGEVSYEWKDSDKNFINAPGPYWNSKALYPLSQALLIGKTTGLDDPNVDVALTRLKGLLVDWFTYSGEGDKRWLYYDSLVGSMYYSVDNFSTNSRLSDHHFTSGYLVYAAAVLAQYDSSFLSEYGEVVKMLLKDYMNYDGDSAFPTLRGYDVYNGHSWADGKGDFGDGNDQESCGEALNSWAAGYLLGVALGDEDLIETAAWGFANELEGVKQYWFNYDEDNWDASLADHTHALGIVWGAKNDYATWFGSNPEFIYGIHWLPTGEYLSSYVNGETEKAVFTRIFNEFLSKVNGTPRTWHSNMWAMQALIDPEAALNAFDASTILSGDYPDELIGSYWAVLSLNYFGNKSTNVKIDVKSSVSASAYENDGFIKLVTWNSSDENKTLSYYVNGVKKSVSIPAKSFIKTEV
ncbi:MAG: DUF5011 domain-containing protein [Bacilli bacterium]|nr:DUF5011 domain-containing protein [Bacilli bacterium]